MRRGTVEYEIAMQQALDALVEEYRLYSIADLMRDWRCNITLESRAVLAYEFKRRGLFPPERKS